MSQAAATAGVQNKYGVEVGDIYYASWGYDETRVNYYKVVRVTATKAEIAPIAGKAVGSTGIDPNSDVVRDWDVLIGVNRESAKKTKLCSVKAGYRGEPSIVLRGGQYWAYPWDGRTQYQSDPQFGR